MLHYQAFQAGLDYEAEQRRENQATLERQVAEQQNAWARLTSDEQAEHNQAAREALAAIERALGL